MLKSFSRRLIHVAVYALLTLWLLFAVMVMALRYWVLPHVSEYRETIAASLSRSIGQPITIGGIEAGWHGLRPTLTLRDVMVQDSQGRPALFLQQVENTLSWRSLLVGGVRLHNLEISGPMLAVRRNAAGQFFVGGVEVGQETSESGFAGWILSQRQIIIRDAIISWSDEKRGAPPLVLKNFNFRLENSGKRHRFGLHAIPPAHLAGPLDVRGNLRGSNLQELFTWRGALYAALERTDLAAWRAWFDLPFDLQRGTGELRLWLNVAQNGIADITADLGLNDIDMRWSEELPRLDLVSVSGRLGGRFAQPGHELRARGLTFTTREGVLLPPSDIIARYTPAAGGKPEGGEIRLNRLDLGALAALAAHLPFSEAQRALLAQSRPRGGVNDLFLQWEGEWQAPAHYRAKGSFAELGVDALGQRESISFSGMSGDFDASEKGGKLALKGRGVGLHLPELFPEALTFATLGAQASWQMRANGVNIRLAAADFANDHLAGHVHGTYHHTPGAPGEIDLNGQLTRADARHASRYIPLTLGKPTRDWLSTSILGGRSSDVRLRLKGNLAHFPFVDEKLGIFEVTAKVSDGVLDYATGWPRIENIALDLLFRGARMDIHAHAGNTYGMKIGKVHTQIADLLGHEELLELEGTASGPTGDMLKFVAQSPVAGMIDHFTEGMNAGGNGNFALKLKIPLRHSKDTQVSGSYQFINNRVDPGEDLPLLEQVNGKLEFTEAQVKIPAIAFQALGGTTTLEGSSSKDGAIRLNLKGRATAASMTRLHDHPMLQKLNGATDWRAQVTIRKKTAELVLDSTLQGLSSALPPPFAKAAGDSVSLRVEKKIPDAQRDHWQISYGDVLSAHFLRRLDRNKPLIERGAIRVGAATLPQAQNGIWLNSDLPALDFDAWYALFKSSPEGPGIGLSGINFRCGRLALHGRHFNDVKVSATSHNENWKAAIKSREMAGDLLWRPEGKGHVEARLRHLSVPDVVAENAAPAPEETSRNWPALDVVAENFQVRQKSLGKLELKAFNEDADWRIERIKLSNPDATLAMDGLWQAWRRNPRTRVNLRLDVQNVGKLLVRLGYPNAVRNGTARLEGQLSWQGSPQEIDYPTLSGEMVLEAHKGQFSKIEPGLGKLLGILSLQALPRRITLDFRDIFSEGFAFDDISGTLKAQRGVVSSDDFRIEGPAAKVTMKGETDVARETQALRVRVAPAISAGVSMAGALLASPVVGVTALVVQKLLKDPLDQIAAYEYSISGTWDNPHVEKVLPPVETYENDNVFYPRPEYQ